MIVEHAVLQVLPGEEARFEAAMAAARPLIAATPGFLELSIARGIEEPNTYLLRVHWERLEDHTEGFRNSDRYAQWRELLHHFYDPFPEVLHFAPVQPQGAGAPHHTHPGVDAYLEKLPIWQRELCAELRALIHAADPDIDETIKRSVQPYFVLDGNVCALLATKDHVNLFLYDPTVPDPQGIINQGSGNATARAIQFYQGDPLNRAAIVDLVAAIAARNRAGGWRSLPD